MPKYKNVGTSPWRRADGELVPRGEIFEATDREQARILRRPAYQRWIELVAAQPDATVPESNGWKLQMSPRRYMQLHPKGPNSKLAKEILDRAVEEDTPSSG